MLLNHGLGARLQLSLHSVGGSSCLISESTCCLGVIRSQVRSIWPRFQMAAQMANSLSCLFPSPKHVRDWMPLLEDLSSPEAFTNKMISMRWNLREQDEWHYISIDATVKPCLKLQGQASYRANKAERNAAAFGDDTAFSQVEAGQAQYSWCGQCRPKTVRLCWKLWQKTPPKLN